MDYILCHLNPVDTLKPYLRSILIISSHLYPCIKWSPLFRSSNQNFQMHFSCPIHISLLEAITFIILDEKHKLWSSSLFTFLHIHVASLLLHQNVLNMQFSVSYIFGALHGTRKIDSQLLTVYSLMPPNGDNATHLQSHPAAWPQMKNRPMEQSCHLCVGLYSSYIPT
jgi:hypothetical protein